MKQMIIANDDEPPSSMEAGTSLTIDMTMDEPAWQSALPALEDIAAQCCDATWQAILNEHQAKDMAAEVSLFWTNDPDIRQLNQQYRHQDKPTNVLSFPLYDGWDVIAPVAQQVPVVALGDIILSLDTIMREANTQDKSLQAHTMHMLVHGMLHLCGYDHQQDDEAERMEAKEIEILSQLGVSNPYQSIS